MNDAKKISFNFTRYAQVIFWVVLFIFLLFSLINVGIYKGVEGAVLLLFCHMVNFYIAYAWLTPRYFEKGRYVSFVAGVVLLLVLLTPFRMWIENNYIVRPFVLLKGRRLGGMVFFSEISIACFAFLFRMSIDSEANKRRIDEIERLQLQTELKFLKSQMNPHFLFNTINNVYALALSRSDKTPAALLKLSGLLRYLLYECNQPTPYHKEIEALESYIALFQLRYEEPLNISLHSDVQSMDMPVEPMLLISLLENAIKHSSIGVAPGAFIDIGLWEDEGKLAASIKNSRSELNHTIREAGDSKDDRGPGRAGGIMDDPAGAAAGGIGLQNIHKRLEMLAPGLSSRSIQIEETSGTFEVRIKIPGI